MNGSVQNPPEEAKIKLVTVTISLEQTADDKIAVKWDRSPNNEETKGKLMTLQMINALHTLNLQLKAWLKQNDETGETTE